MKRGIIPYPLSIIYQNRAIIKVSQSTRGGGLYLQPTSLGYAISPGKRQMGNLSDMSEPLWQEHVPLSFLRMNEAVFDRLVGIRAVAAFIVNGA